MTAPSAAVPGRSRHTSSSYQPACSPFFRSILRQNPCEHPLLYLKGVEFTDLQAVVRRGYVNQEELNSFLAVAEDLKVKGLIQTDSSDSTNAPKP